MDYSDALPAKCPDCGKHSYALRLGAICPYCGEAPPDAKVIKLEPPGWTPENFRRNASGELAKILPFKR